MKPIYLTATLGRLAVLSALLITTALVSQASAADLGAREPTSFTKAPAYVPVSNWSGLYIGGNVGYGWGNGNTDFSFLPSVAAFGEENQTLHNKLNGVIGGGQVGYNWQIGSIVTGLEADFQGSGIKGNVGIQTVDTTALALPVTLSTDHKLSWFGTVRGRFGFTLTPTLLLYGTGGFAYGDVEANSNFLLANDRFPASVSVTKTGWTAGAGAEWMFTQHWSAKVEYLRVDLGKASATSPLLNGGIGVNYQSHAQYDSARLGVNYHFN
jgi:outer membrane immunogenic protein